MTACELAESGHASQQVIETQPMSIVIPAHNEESVIGRCLRNLLDGAQPGELEIIVACNGCSDRTAEIAASFGNRVRVVETRVASKIAALNLGDQAATGFPRFYIDADVVVSVESLRRTAEVLRHGAYLAASPAIRFDLSRSDWLVKAFYAVWQLQPYFDSGRLGAGLYAVSQVGHARLGAFPQITADDEYVRRLFSEAERTTARDATFTVTPPRTLSDLIRIKTRSRRGTNELERTFPEMRRAPTRGRWRLLARIAVRPWIWWAAPIYAYVVWMTWYRSRSVQKPGRQVVWERDLSSRVLQGHDGGRSAT